MAKRVRDGIQDQSDPTTLPRFSGIATYARLPQIRDLPSGTTADIAVIGVPFDSAATFRPGARFGPSSVRQASRLIRPYHPDHDLFPFRTVQVADAGDIGCPPFDLQATMDLIERQASELINAGSRLCSIGGDHSIALPLLRAVHKKFGKVTLIHFDAHLDTFEGCFGQDITHGSMFRVAAAEGLFDEQSSCHVGIRGTVYSPENLKDDARFGFQIFRCNDVEELGSAEMIRRIRARVMASDHPVYISVDIDVLDPAFAPGTGTPECGGLSSRELFTILRGLDGAGKIVGVDVVEVSPSYDHAEVTALAAAQVCHELICLMIKNSPSESEQ